MKLHLLDTGTFKLDGGAMFGVVPKSIWQRLSPPDENNLCTWAKRCWLIEHGDRLCLVDTGLGNKQADKFFSHYHLEGNQSLEEAIKRAGYSTAEVTDVFLTHMHFDHVGGAVAWNETRTGYVPAFPNAQYWTNKDHFEWATKPNPREKASFLEENIRPLLDHGVLNFIEKGSIPTALPFADIWYADGHTEKQMCPVVELNGQRFVFMADLLPSVHHIKAPYVMAYDVRPLVTMQEKEVYLNKAIAENLVMVMQHDKDNEAVAIERNADTGRITVSEKGSLLDFL